MRRIGNDLRAARHRRTIERGEPDELPAIVRNQCRALEQWLADAPLLAIDERAQSEIVRGRAAIGFGADDDMPFLDAKRAHRLRAVRHDAELSAGLYHGLPHRE